MNKIRKLVTPTNIFRLLLAINVIVISLFSIGKADIMPQYTRIRLNYLTQLSLILLFLINGVEGVKDNDKTNAKYLLVLLFLINGVEGVKDNDKTKRYLAFFNFTVVIIMVIINVLILLK